MANISLLLYSNIVKTFSVGTSCHLNLFLAGAKQVQIESMEDPVRVLLLFDPVDITILRSLAYYWFLLTCQQFWLFRYLPAGKSDEVLKRKREEYRYLFWPNFQYIMFLHNHLSTRLKNCNNNAILFLPTPSISQIHHLDQLRLLSSSDIQRRPTFLYF